MEKLFISHNSKDDAFVRNLRTALAYHGQDGWIDSRELRGGDPLWTEIEKAINAASAYAVVVSPDALQSKWVGREVKHALAVRDQRGMEKFPVIPLSLDGTKLGVLEDFFGEEPIYIPVSSEPGGIEAAINPLLVALGKRLPTDIALPMQPAAEPLEELVLELTDLKFHEEGKIPRASARARLVYEPATPGQPAVKSEQSWRFIAPIGPIEAEELRWYLEKYAIWPSAYFRDRARKVEENLVQWGQLLHEAAMPVVHTANVTKAWAKIDDDADRRFSIYIDPNLEVGAAEADVKSAKESATLLLALPWELLHDGDFHLFQSAKPVRVRRRLPNTKVFDVPVVATPIRILLVTARPEDESCSYIDHRASALPLVQAMESLPGLVNIHILSPPTLPALRAELDRARSEKKPYHVVHFDGHGVFNREVGLGGLCFEEPEDAGKLELRRHVTVFTKELGPLLRDHRIPLVFLEACQTAQAEKASESVASELLKVGVASVVAMSHSVLVETARRFVKSFYEALAAGERVGDAMLAGQRDLKDDTRRGKIFGAGELRLEDWFVPVLYQEKDDPQLFKITPAKQTQEDFRAALAIRLGDLPEEPETGFIGRSRELLALQRLLRSKSFAVVLGQGGEGKTALAAEFARWMVRSQQIHRAAFISVETHSDLRAVIDALGKQLAQKNFSAAGNLEEAIREVERALREQPALLIVDNMESILLPLYMERETPEVLSEDAREELKAILALCDQLMKVGDTRIIFTSRQSLPAPFDAALHRRELHQLDREDAVKLVERVLNAAGGDSGTSTDAAREEIEQLVDAVHCHARTLALLAPSLRQHGVASTRESLVELMIAMEKTFPGSREKSVFASVELSLRRMSPANRERAGALGVFHGSVNLVILRLIMEWEETDVLSLAGELVDTGLATWNPNHHLTLNPALCPYLRSRMNATDHEALTARWIDFMEGYVRFLVQQQNQNAELAAALVALELPNLFALFDLVQRAGNAARTIDLATSLYRSLRSLGKPRLVMHVGRVRDTAASGLAREWNHARFQEMRNRIEQQADSGHLGDAIDEAQRMLQFARAAGEKAYRSAGYDLAMSCIVNAELLDSAGREEEALPLVEEARKRFEALEKENDGWEEKTMVTHCFAALGQILLGLGRLDEAAAVFETGIRRAENLGDERSIAIQKGHLGDVRSDQGRYDEAISAYAEAREQFTRLEEPVSVGLFWHHAGMAHQAARQWEAAEDAYRKSLAIAVQHADVVAQTNILGSLGTLYIDIPGRLEEAVTFCRQAVDRSVESGDRVKEAASRNNLALSLSKLRRFQEAREEIEAAIECWAQFGNASEQWKTWNLLANIETEAGNAAAAQDAKRKAVDCYLAYRRDGGENQSNVGRISRAVTQLLLDGDATAHTMLNELASDPHAASLLPFIRSLQKIVTGSRDRTLADTPDLNYVMAAEILLLLETLKKQN